MALIIAGTVRVPPEELEALRPHQLRMLAARSLGPTKMASMPGTEKMASAFSTDWICSHCRTTSNSSLARA